MKNYKYIDIHSHLNLSPLKEDQEAVISRMREKGVSGIVVGVDLETSREAVRLAETHPDMLWATVGLHPTDSLKEDFNFEEYFKLAQNSKVVAIGECGLDYFRMKNEENEQLKQSQKELFLQHIKLAEQVGKPLMVHARPSKGTVDAYTDVLDILAHHPDVRANFHFFVGDMSITERILDRGDTMSFDGPITFTEDYTEVIKRIPLDSLHAETDAPFAAPVPYRGKTCEPWMVTEVVNRIAEIKDVPIEEVTEAFRINAERVFKVSL